MTRSAEPAPRTRPRGRWWMLGAALLLVGTGCLVVGLQVRQHPLPAPVSQGAPHAIRRHARPSAHEAAAPVVRSAPVSLSIPSIGLSLPVSELGLNLDGTVQVPTDYQEPGWYRFGPSPGQVGSAVILGHVDTYQGPAAFFQLRTLQDGDQISVTLTDGAVARFAVTAVATYTKAQFPAQEVYGPHGYSTLQLVTCGGTFDSETGHYLSNVVVYSSLISFTPVAVGTEATGTQ